MSSLSDSTPRKPGDIMRDSRGNALHPFCNRCGWRKGGIDSWDGNRCKCGHYEPPMREPEIISLASQSPEGRTP